MGTPSITDPKAKTFVAKNGSFLEKEFLSKEVSGRKVELDEVPLSRPICDPIQKELEGPTKDRPAY